MGGAVAIRRFHPKPPTLGGSLQRSVRLLMPGKKRVRSRNDNRKNEQVLGGSPSRLEEQPLPRRQGQHLGANRFSKFVSHPFL